MVGNETAVKVFNSGKFEFTEFYDNETNTFTIQCGVTRIGE